jgi:hypothetical protein
MDHDRHPRADVPARPAEAERPARPFWDASRGLSMAGSVASTRLRLVHHLACRASRPARKRSRHHRSPRGAVSANTTSPQRVSEAIGFPRRPRRAVHPSVGASLPHQLSSGFLRASDPRRGPDRCLLGRRGEGQPPGLSQSPASSTMAAVAPVSLVAGHRHRHRARTRARGSAPRTRPDAGHARGCHRVRRGVGVVARMALTLRGPSQSVGCRSARRRDDPGEAQDT